MKHSLTTLFALVVFVCSAQIPNGYYNSATGTGYTLKSQLHDIIDGHNQQSYEWSFFETNDVDIYYENDGTLLDIYSENPTGPDPYNFTQFNTRCGNQSAEGDCYNREHSFPASWFNDAYPTYSDVHHLFLSDGRVNNFRGSLPFGEVGSPNFTSQNGSLRGSSRSGLGYSGTVFEPIDEFKGDLARAYFYLATRYEDVLTGWNSVMLDGSSDQVFTEWALEMLISWHNLDQVSQKEIDRNNAAYEWQGNRNPFVDHPEWVNAIWGDGSIDPTPTISLSKASINLGEVIAGTSSASESYTVSGTDLEGNITVSVSSPFELSLTNSTWSQQVTVTQSSGSASDVVYVRFSPTEPNGALASETISHSSADATTKSLTVSGTEGTIALDAIAEVREGTDGQVFTIEGVVTSPELSSTHGQFFVQDESAGIFVFYSGNANVVNRGDRVRITGERDTFNGQLEILPSSLDVLSSNENLPEIADITSLDLTSSSDYLGLLVRITGVTLPSPAQWPTSSTASGTSVSADANGTSFVIRIDENSFYDGTSAPTGDFVLQGVLDFYDGAIQIYPFVDGDIQEESVLDPTLSVNPTSLDFEEVIVGSSSILSFAVTGTDLTENVTITSFDDFELSDAMDGTYSNSLVAGVDGGDIDQVIYIRYTPSSTGQVGSTISLASSGEDASVSVSGEGVEDTSPSIIFNTSGFNADFGTLSPGAVSDIRSYQVSGENLDGNVTVQAPDGFEVSVFPTSLFGASVSLGVSNGTMSTKTIYVRFSPNETGSFDGAISHTSGEFSENLSVMGSGASASLSIDDSGFNGDFGQVIIGETSVPGSFTLSGANLSGTVMVQAPSGFEVSLSASTGFNSSIAISNTGELSDQVVYVRFKPTVSGSFSGNVVSSIGAMSAQVSVSGSGLQVTASVKTPEIKIYPNPVDGVLKIENLSAGATIRIFDSMGRRMNVKRLGEGVDISEFDPGQYYLTIAGSKNGVMKFMVR